MQVYLNCYFGCYVDIICSTQIHRRALYTSVSHLEKAISEEPLTVYERLYMSTMLHSVLNDFSNWYSIIK